MEILTREKIRRMVNVTGTGVGGGSSFDAGQINEMLGSYLTVENAKQQFVSIEFFKRLFQAHGTDENDDPTDVDPNDTETTITDIEAMFGFWTEQYLSALGNGGGGGTGGSTALSDLVDVALSNPTNGQALVYNATTGKWTNQTIGGGADMATVWQALAAATNEQINISHLANALSGYAQTSALANYLPIAGGTVTGNLSVGGTLAVTGAATLSSSITAGSFVKSGGTASQFLKADGSVDNNTYATQTWVDDNYVSIAFFSRLFKAYNGTTLVSPNNTTSTIDNIKAMFGFWTAQYLSALGRGSGGTGGSTALSDLVDVAIASPTNGQALVYNSTTGKWTNQTISGGGTDMATVWSNLAAATNEQINASHLTNALSGYATISDLTGYLLLTGGTLSSTNVGVLKINKTNNFASLIGFYGNINSVASTEMGYLGCRAVDTPCFRTTGGTYYNLLHTGNFATEIGSSLFTSLTSTNGTNLSVTIGGTTESVMDMVARGIAQTTLANDGDLATFIDNHRLIYTAKGGGNTVQDKPSNVDAFGVMSFKTAGGYYGQILLSGGNNLFFRSSNVFSGGWKQVLDTNGTAATATALATARTLWGQSFDGSANVSGNMTDVGSFKQSGAINMQGSTASYCQGIRLHPTNNGISSIFFGCDVDSGMTAGMFGITHNTTGLRIRGQASTTSTSLVDYLTVAYGGNIGIGTSSPSYLLHVNGQAAAQTFRSTVETGTAPLVVASSTLVTNLNADRLDGKHASDFATASDVTTLQGYFDSSGAAKKAVQLKTSRTLWGQSFDGTGDVTGAMTSVGSITLTNNSRISNATGSGGSLYIGRSDDAGWVKMSDMCSRQGDSYWKIKSNGDATFGNMLSNGYVTALSDERHKTIVGDVDLRVEQIAAMPAIRYRWNERRDNGLYVGSIAQAWQTILPEVVMTSDDEQRTLSLSYGVAALLASITTARKVVNHEQRIAQLEKENMELRNELNRIKAA